MTIRRAHDKTSGVHTFYVGSEPRLGEYIVTHVRRAGMNRWTCTCPQFVFRGQVKGSHRFCKHIRAVIANQFEIRKQEAA